MKNSRLPGLLLALVLALPLPAQAFTVDQVVALPRRPEAGDLAAKSLISIGIEIPGKAGPSFTGGMCSGALVGRRAVLTAAHCVNGMVEIARMVLKDPSIHIGTLDLRALSAKGFNFYVSFGRGFPNRVEAGQSFAVKAFHINEESFRRTPGYPANPNFNLESDIALLELESAVPDANPDLNLSGPVATAFWPVLSLKIYGYNFAGTKGDLRYLATSGLLPETLGLEGEEAKKFSEAVSGELSKGIGHLLANGRSPCPGTSGGPIVALENGLPVVVGVLTEGGSRSCEPPAEPEGAMLARTDTIGTKRQPSVSFHYDWLMRTLGAIEGR